MIAMMSRLWKRGAVGQQVRYTEQSGATGRADRTIYTILPEKKILGEMDEFRFLHGP